MLDFLDSLCRALAARDQLGIRRQLRHPLARALPAPVRVEAHAIARAGKLGRLPPTRTFHFYYQTLQLLAPPGFHAIEEPFPEPTGEHSRASDLAATR